MTTTQRWIAVFLIWLAVSVAFQVKQCRDRAAMRAEFARTMFLVTNNVAPSKLVAIMQVSTDGTNWIEIPTANVEIHSYSK